MPAAIVLYLDARANGVLHGATGQHAHGFWLTSWRSIAAATGDSHHDDRPLRQFTISPLLGLADARHGRTTVRAGEIARLRITAVDDATTTALLGNWLLKMPGEFSMGGLPWRVRRLALSPTDHPAAGFITYAALRDRYRTDHEPPDRWTVAFMSPTAIHLPDDRYLPFPLPEHLIDGWLERWLEYAPVALLPPGDTRPSFIDRVRPRLRINHYRLKTVSFRLRFEQEVPQIGCVGRLTFDAPGLSGPDRAVLATLVDFAFYCGTGHHTTMGMGQTTPAPPT